MTESKVFTDNFSRSFTEPGDFFQFLSDRKARSKWMTAPSRELQFEPVERGSTLGNLYMQIYDHNGAAEILEDTMENTSLLLKVDGKDYSNLLQHTHNLLKGTIDMEVFLIMPTTPEGKAKLSKELAKFHAEQALKMVQKLPCPTEQKLELIDAVVEHLRSKQ